MIPTKDKFYAIACFGPYDYNRFGGIARFTGKVDYADAGDPSEFLYEFEITETDSTTLTFFTESEILLEKYEPTFVKTKFTIQHKYTVHGKNGSPDEDRWGSYIPEHYYFNDKESAKMYLEREIVKMKGDEFRILEVEISTVDKVIETFKY